MDTEVRLGKVRLGKNKDISFGDVRDSDESPTDQESKTHDEIIMEEWNKLPLKNIRAVTNNSNRKKLLQARIKEYGVEAIVEAIRSIPESKFLMGQNKNGWVITFDWLIKPNNFIKVLEGNYTDKEITDGTHQGDIGEDHTGDRADYSYPGWTNT